MVAMVTVFFLVRGQKMLSAIGAKHRMISNVHATIGLRPRNASFAPAIMSLGISLASGPAA